MFNTNFSLIILDAIDNFTVLNVSQDLTNAISFNLVLDAIENFTVSNISEDYINSIYFNLSEELKEENNEEEVKIKLKVVSIPVNKGIT